jgi:glycosyltransferase involved in cell wall biosynthesis
MKVLFDTTIFDQQRIGGISRYCFDLMMGLKGEELVFPCEYSNNHLLESEGRFSAIKRYPVEREQFKFLRRFKRLKERVFATGKEVIPPNQQNRMNVIAELEKGQFDVFHPTYYADYFIGKLKGGKMVVTIHDMIHEKFPEFFPFSDKTALYKQNMIEKADAIIAISESTKLDIQRFYPTLSKKIFVVYHSLTSEKIKYDNERTILLTPQKYLLFLGVREGYKNFYFMVRALRPLFLADRELHLVCTGAPFSREEVEWLAQLGLSNQIVSFFFEEKVLPALYRHAEALLFPSLCEGFGYPILEAFTNSCPVVLSRIPVMEEIAGDAAVYFDPKDPVELLSCVKNLLEKGEIRRSLRERGAKQVLRYSRKSTLQGTFDVYRSVIENA